MSGSELVIRQTGEVASPDAINAYLTRILETVPDQGEGDISGILAQIINSDGTDDLDSPWQSGGMGRYNGYAIEIRSIKRMESDFSGGLGWYLLCEGIILETGEYQAFTTSSAAIMAQLLVAFARGWLPWRAYVKIATKPTKKGFYPMHLETYRDGPYILEPEPAAAGPRHLGAAPRRTPPQRRPEPAGRPHEAVNDTAAAHAAQTAGQP